MDLPVTVRRKEILDEARKECAEGDADQLGHRMADRLAGRLARTEFALKNK